MHGCPWPFYLYVVCRVTTDSVANAFLTARTDVEIDVSKYLSFPENFVCNFTSAGQIFRLIYFCWRFVIILSVFCCGIRCVGYLPLMAAVVILQMLYLHSAECGCGKGGKCLFWQTLVCHLLQKLPFVIVWVQVWQSRVEIDHYSVTYFKCITTFEALYFCYGWGSYALYKLMNTWHVYTVLTEVLCYSASNAVMRLKYATE